MNPLYRTCLLLCLLFVLGVVQVWARVDGEAVLGYTHFSQTGDDTKDLTLSGFTQNYSVMYRKDGLIAGGRGGQYNFGLGAEWAALSADIDGHKIDDDAFKILYRGELVLAPGALPFRFNAYSYDLQAIQPRTGLLSSFPNQALFDPGIDTTFTNGETIVSGLQLMAGIQNGSYLGRHRELLSHWPRLFIDYRDLYRHDDNVFTPQHYRERNLAFISLNKKDNWFHYRINNVEDYLNVDQSSTEKIFLLGTIDHKLKRHWVNFTNWIKISADGSFREFTYEKDPANRSQEDYHVNFFAEMQHGSSSVKNYTSLMRRRSGERNMNKIVDVPFYVSRTLNPGTSAQAIFYLKRIDETGGLAEKMVDNGDVYYVRGQLETNKQSQVKFNPGLEMELITGDYRESQAVRGNLEGFSNPLLKRNLRWQGQTSVAWFKGTREVDLVEENNFWEADLAANLNYRWRNFTVAFDQSLLYAEGTYSTAMSEFLSPKIARGFTRSVGRQNPGFEDAGAFRSESILSFEHTTRSRSSNRFQLHYRVHEQDGEILDSLEFSHRFKSSGRLWKVTLEHFYINGDDDNSYAGVGGGDLNRKVAELPAPEKMLHRGIVEFLPNRLWKSSLRTNATWAKHRSDEVVSLTVEQTLQRDFYAKSSTKRLVASLSQSITYDQVSGIYDRRLLTYSVAGRYFPTRNWWLTANLSYEDFDAINNYLEVELGTGLNFPLMQIDFNYIYGALEDSRVVAHRYEVNVRKTF